MFLIVVYSFTYYSNCNFSGYLCISPIHCKYLHTRHLMQDTLDHDDGPLTDLSQPANNDQLGHNSVATGPDQTDQNLYNQPGDGAGTGQDTVDTVHASDGQLVAHIQDGYHDVPGNDIEGPGVGDDNDYGSIDPNSLTDDVNDDAGATVDAADNTLDNTNTDSQSSNNVQSARNNNVNSLDVGEMIDTLDQDRGNALLGIDQHSDIVPVDTDVPDEAIQTDDDYGVADDYVIPDSAALVHQDTIDTHDSVKASQSDTLNHYSDSAIANHSNSLLDHHTGVIADHSDTLTDHHDSAVPVNTGDNSVPRNSDSLDNPNSLSAHITILPHNDGMILDPHSAINDSARLVSNGRNENNAPVISGNSQVGHNVEGSGHAPIRHNNTADHNTGHQIDHNTGLLLDSEFGHIDQPGNQDGHETQSSNHNSGTDGLNAPSGRVIVEPDGGSGHSAGVNVPDVEHLHEGSGSQPYSGTGSSQQYSGTDHGTEPGHEHGSGQHRRFNKP